MGSLLRRQRYPACDVRARERRRRERRPVLHTADHTGSILQKHTGEGDFDVPKVQLDAIKALRSGSKTPYLDTALGDVPVNFLSTVDVTGGNSGSPPKRERRAGGPSSSMPLTNPCPPTSSSTR